MLALLVVVVVVIVVVVVVQYILCNAAKTNDESKQNIIDCAFVNLCIYLFIYSIPTGFLKIEDGARY